MRLRDIKRKSIESMGVYAKFKPVSSNGLCLSIGYANFYIALNAKDNAYIIKNLHKDNGHSRVYKKFKDYEITECFIEE